MSSAERAHTLIRRFGREAVSFQGLTTGCEHWFDDDDACVSYVASGGAWVAVGAPIAAPEREAEVATRFAAAARREGKRVRLFGVEQTFASDVRWASRCLGEQPIWDPSVWPDGLSPKLATQIRQHRARARVTVREASPAELRDPGSSVRHQLDRLAARWLAARKMAPLGFLLRLDLYAHADERRYFVAEHEGTLVAALIAMPIPAHGAWLLETTLRDPDAPGGAMELTFDRALRTFAVERAAYVSYGLCPLIGTGSPLDALLRRGFGSLYDFDGLRHFKGKLAPIAWSRVYLSYPRGDSPRLALADVVRAFCPSSVLAFGAHTFAQRVLTRGDALLRAAEAQVERAYLDAALRATSP